MTTTPHWSDHRHIDHQCVWAAVKEPLLTWVCNCDTAAVPLMSMSCVRYCSSALLKSDSCNTTHHLCGWRWRCFLKESQVFLILDNPFKRVKWQIAHHCTDCKLHYKPCVLQKEGSSKLVNLKKKNGRKKKNNKTQDWSRISHLDLDRDTSVLRKIRKESPESSKEINPVLTRQDTTGRGRWVLKVPVSWATWKVKFRNF